MTISYPLTRTNNILIIGCRLEFRMKTESNCQFSQKSTNKWKQSLEVMTMMTTIISNKQMAIKIQSNKNSTLNCKFNRNKKQLVRILISWNSNKVLEITNFNNLEKLMMGHLRMGKLYLINILIKGCSRLENSYQLSMKRISVNR